VVFSKIRDVYPPRRGSTEPASAIAGAGFRLCRARMDKQIRKAPLERGLSLIRDG
jgi:hypothetical protein